MPAKGSIDNFTGKHSMIDVKFWKKYVKETGNEVSYEEFKAILAASFAEIQKWTLREPIGFQMPGLGNLSINKFEQMPGFKTYIGSSNILNHNLHTGGYVFKIQWFHSCSAYSSRIPYWFFRANRTFKRTLAQVLKANDRPNYNSFMQDHFITKSLRLQCK